MADVLATPGDLTTLLGATDTGLATLLIECATAVVQAAVRQRIVRVGADAITLDLDEFNSGPDLFLPELPVVSVASVAIGATTVTDYTAQVSRGRLWRAYGWRSVLVGYYGQPSTVTVTYTHGYAAGDQKLQLGRGAVLGLIRQAVANPTGATSFRIDDYAATYERMAAFLEASPSLLRLLRAQYKRPVRSIRLVAR